MRANLHIVTGAPGSGKTAILSRLWGEVRCVDEPAREVLAEQRSTGGDGTPELIERTYKDAGYTLLEVHPGSIEDRAAFVRSFLG